MNFRDRGCIKIVFDGGEVCVYTHKRGEDLPWILARALKKMRRDDLLGRNEKLARYLLKEIGKDAEIRPWDAKLVDNHGFAVVGSYVHSLKSDGTEATEFGVGNANGEGGNGTVRIEWLIQWADKVQWERIKQEEDNSEEEEDEEADDEKSDGDTATGGGEGDADDDGTND